MPLNAHSKAMPSSNYYDQPRSLNNEKNCQRLHLLKGSNSYRLVSLLWGLTSNAHNEARHRSPTIINLDHLNKYECSHPIPIKNLDHTHWGIKTILIMSLILTQNKTNTKNTNISIPTKYYNTCNNSHTLQQKIQVQTYMVIEKLSMT